MAVVSIIVIGIVMICIMVPLGIMAIVDRSSNRRFGWHRFWCLGGGWDRLDGRFGWLRSDIDRRRYCVGRSSVVGGSAGSQQKDQCEARCDRAPCTFCVRDGGRCLHAVNVRPATVETL